MASEVWHDCFKKLVNVKLKYVTYCTHKIQQSQLKTTTGGLQHSRHITLSIYNSKFYVHGLKKNKKTLLFFQSIYSPFFFWYI